MGSFAKIQNNIVVKVIAAEPDFFNTFVDDSPGIWIQTSYNTRGGIHYQPNSNTPSADQSKALRKNYAGIGYTYDLDRDAFIPPKPYTSWVLDETTCLWEAPVTFPNIKTYVQSGQTYYYRIIWNEENSYWTAIVVPNNYPTLKWNSVNLVWENI